MTVAPSEMQTNKRTLLGSAADDSQESKRQRANSSDDTGGEPEVKVEDPSSDDTGREPKGEVVDPSEEPKDDLEGPKSSESQDVKEEGDAAPDASQPSAKAATTDEAMPAEKPEAVTFPVKLYSLLQSKEFETAVWWLPAGDCFRLVPKEFTVQILEKHFQGTKFESFTRKLNRWGFKKVVSHDFDSVPDSVTYQHPVFHRDKPELVKLMTGGKKKGMLKDDPSQNLSSRGTSTALARSSILNAQQEQLAAQHALQQARFQQARDSQLNAHFSGQATLLSTDMATRQRMEQALAIERVLAAQQAQRLGAGLTADQLRMQMLRDTQMQQGQMMNQQQLNMAASQAPFLGGMMPRRGSGSNTNNASGNSGGLSAAQIQQVLGTRTNSNDQQQRLLELYLLQEQQQRNSQGRNDPRGF